MAIASRSAAGSRPHHCAILCLVACAIFISLAVMREEWLLDGDGRRRLAYLDPAVDAASESQHQSLARPSVVDASVPDRLATYYLREEENSMCDDVLLYLPHDYSWEGHGRQLNSYLLAAMIATYANKAMVVQETVKSPFKTNSQFGCPSEAWIYSPTGKRTGQKNKQFQEGLSRLIKHPEWLSSSCSVPCQGTYTYKDWENLKKTRNSGPYYPQLHPIQEVRCDNDNGRRTKVLVVGGKEVQDYFDGHFKKRMLRRPSDEAYGWAMRLGAKPDEAEKFAELQDERDIWNYISALMVRSGLLEFQPWIARDVGTYIAESNLPQYASYDAVHVRRGDKLEEVRPFVESYWSYHTQINPVSQALMVEPGKYIPLSHYLSHFDDEGCESELQPHLDVRPVYVATDDPEEVKREIELLPKDAEGNTISERGCHKFQFFFTPHEKHRSSFTVGFHLKDGPDNGACKFRYWRNIASVADMMIAAKSDTFVGEFNSNWARLVRLFRMQFNESAPGDIVIEREMKIAWGDQEPLPPGM